MAKANQEGFSMIPNRIIDGDLTEHQRAVLIYLYRIGNNGSPIYPSLTTIAGNCGIGNTLVKETLRELKIIGVLSVKYRHINGTKSYHSNLYEINIQAVKVKAKPHSDQPMAHSDQPMAHSDQPMAHSDQPMAHSDQPMAHSDQEVSRHATTINNNNINNYLKRTITNNAEAHPVMTFLLKDDSEYPIFESRINEYKELYPYIEDIMQSFRNMKSWLMANPAKRKTTSGVWRFVNTWLKSDNERAGAAKARDKPDDKKPEAWESIDFAAAGLEPMSPEKARLLPPGGTYAQKRKRYKELFMKNGIDMETRRAAV